MERNGPDSTDRLLRATRSLAFNRKLLPLVEKSINHAEKTIRTHLLLNNLTELQIGSYQVRLNTSDEVQLTLLSDSDSRFPLSCVEENRDAY